MGLGSSYVRSSTESFEHVSVYSLQFVTPGALAAEVAQVMWWMRHYGGPTPKRHYLYSNSAAVKQLDRGQLRGWKKEKTEREAQGTHRPLVDKYTDKQGKRRYKGNKTLRQSEPLA